MGNKRIGVQPRDHLKNTCEILAPKNTKTKIQNSADGFKSRAGNTAYKELANQKHPKKRTQMRWKRVRTPREGVSAPHTRENQGAEQTAKK